MVFHSVYHHFNYHPSFVQAVQHVVLGFTSFTMLFFLHQLWIGTLISKFHQKGVFLRSQVMEIAVLVNSSIFAIIICFVSLIVILQYRTSVMYDEHPIIRHCMCLGVSYFFYDIIAMFLTFRQKYYEDHPKDNSSQTLLQRFASSKNLILVHHIIIPLLGIPVSYNQNFKMGDFLFAIGFLMEASTPFVCLRRILEILGWKNSLAYLVNGLLMTFTFFWCRIFGIFYIYYIFAKEKGKTVTETITSTVPFICTACMLAVLIPQIYWWILMIQGCSKFLRRSRCTKNE